MFWKQKITRSCITKTPFRWTDDLKQRAGRNCPRQMPAEEINKSFSPGVDGYKMIQKKLLPFFT